MTCPLEARHFNINFSATAIRTEYVGQKIDGVLDMFEHVPEYDALGAQPDIWAEIFSLNIRVFAFIGWVQAGDLKTPGSKLFEEITLAAADLYEFKIAEMPMDDA